MLVHNPHEIYSAVKRGHPDYHWTYIVLFQRRPSYTLSYSEELQILTRRRRYLVRTVCGVLYQSVWNNARSHLRRYFKVDNPPTSGPHSLTRIRRRLMRIDLQ
jgi:hypothetical protein